MMIKAEKAQRLMMEAIEQKEKVAQAEAENWVSSVCPSYVHEAASEGRDRTREFKCPKAIAKRAIKVLENLGYTVKYRENAELIRLVW